MNKNAEAFKDFLKEKNIDVFEMEELEGDQQQTVVFRSRITTEGQQLPTVVILDESIFALVRVQISPKALTESNQLALLKMVNEESASYKPFKFYLTKDGDLMMDVCIVLEEELKGDTIYTMFSFIINYLEENYRRFMQCIWQGN